jgi:hypothetical protein
MESDNEVDVVASEDATSSNGPWAILLCGLAGLIGMLANWILGNQTPSSFITSCAVFAALMYAILWAARRSSEDLENQ